MEFTSREIAVAIWLGIGLIFVVRVAGKSLLQLLRALMHPIILTVIGAALAYVGLCVAVLAHFGFWEISNLKTTVLWVVTTASVRVAKAGNTDTEPKFFSKTLRETLSVAFIVEFLVANYNFSIWVELVLVPLVGFVAMLLAVAKTEKKFHAVNTLLEWVLVAFVLTYLGHAVYEVLQHIRELATADTLRELFLPVGLSLLFMPFLLGLNLYSVYEQIFGALEWGIQDPAIRRYAKRQALLRFGTRLEDLRKWRRLVMMERPDSREGIDRLFAEIAIVRRHERNPQSVDPADGWLPQAAMKFLAEDGFVNEDYHRGYDQWSSISKAVKVGERSSMNTITFQVIGEAFAANELVLELSVFMPADGGAEDADERFAALMAKLLVAVLGVKEAQEFAATLNAETFDRRWRGYRFRLAREEWRNTKGGYEREFVIQTEAARQAAQKREAELVAFVKKETNGGEETSP